MYKIAEQLLKPVSENPIQAFYTDKFQLFDMIEVILSRLPQCNRLIMTSFSISEEFIRKIFRFKTIYKIDKIELILDSKAAIKVQKLNLFLKNTFDEVFLTKNHGKVILFDSEPRVSICTSQNQTRGNRKESHLVTTSIDCFESFLKAIEEMKSTSIKL